MKCGCEIEIKFERNLNNVGFHAMQERRFISFCPLHAVAEEMEMALKVALPALQEASEDYNNPHFTDRCNAGPRMEKAKQKVSEVLSIIERTSDERTNSK